MREIPAKIGKDLSLFLSQSTLVILRRLQQIFDFLS